MLPPYIFLICQKKVLMMIIGDLVSSGKEKEKKENANLHEFCKKMVYK